MSVCGLFPSNLKKIAWQMAMAKSFLKKSTPGANVINIYVCKFMA
jgi:hypothetical protein